MTSVATAVHHVISLGAGVQSSTMALMAAHGEITPMPEYAIFANTGAEPREVYEWLEWLKTQLPFPVYEVSGGDLTDDCMEVKTAKKGHKYTRALIPAFVAGHGIFGRKCTQDYKIVPLRRKVRQLSGIYGKQCKELTVVQWLGISWDEMQRMKFSQEAWLEMRYPLIDLRMTREDCKTWMKKNGYEEPPRSACKYCPFHSQAEWRRLKAMPKEWKEIVQFEKDLQVASLKNEGPAKMKGLPYLHNSRTPIDEIDFKDYDDQIQFSFMDECEGMCGV